MKIKDFYNTEYVNFCSYDNFRKIGCYVDGLKPSARKSVYTLLGLNSEVKVSVLQSKVAEKTKYIHGEQSLFGVIVGLAQNFAGTNNLPLFKRKGNFGNRMIQEASAGRYIQTIKEDYLNLIFRDEDEAIIPEQIFEGDVIEPKYYVPIIPIIAINGSEGISPGFAQKILPRDCHEVIDFLMNRLKNGNSLFNLIPHYNGFKGKVEKTGEKSFEIKGLFSRLNSNKIEITEIPVEYDLKSYQSVLDKLEDEGKIKGYTDLSNDDNFHFVVSMEDLKNMTDEEIYKLLKLSKNITENYTCINELGTISEFHSFQEILDSYIQIRLKSYELRKKKLLESMNYNLEIKKSKRFFIKLIIDRKLDVCNKSVSVVCSELSKIPEIKEVDEYKYLLDIPIKSLTKEQYEKLGFEIETLEKEIKVLSEKTIESLWLDDLNLLLEKIGTKKKILEEVKTIKENAVKKIELKSQERFFQGDLF